MFKNNLLIAWRNLKKSGSYALINIVGLAAGLTGFIIMLLYLNYELSYDTWDPALKRVYKIGMKTDEEVMSTTPAPLGSLLAAKLPQVEAATTMQDAGSFEVLLSAGEKKIYQLGGIEADSNFLKVFPFALTASNAATALDKPNAVVISHDLSAKLFGKENPIGQIIRIHNVFDAEVTGVFSKPSTPAHFQAHFIYRSPYEKSNKHWQNFSYQTYVKTKAAISPTALQGLVDEVYYNDQVKQNGESLVAYRAAGHQAGLFVDAVSAIHNFPSHGSSNFTKVAVLVILAILLLLAGAINFSNLSIAASARRAKEIGVRKVLGSGRGRIALQFLLETTLQCILALILAMAAASLLLPYFNQAFQLELTFFDATNFWQIIFQLGICLLAVILLSGIYPAVFLSNYNPGRVLKGDYTRGNRGALLRNALIVVQFVVAAFFITSTLVIRSQLQYMQEKDKGMVTDQLIRLETTQKMREANFDATRQELLQLAGVKQVAKTTMVPGDFIADTSLYTFRINGQEKRMASVKISEAYFETIGVPLVTGRWLDGRQVDQRTKSALINETAARQTGLQNVVGAVLTFPSCDTVPVQVVGVVKDFNVAGYEQTILPTVFTINNGTCMYQSGGAILVKLEGGKIPATIAAIEKAWKTLEPDRPIRYTFVDENFANLFSSHIRLQQVISFFALAAVLIALMGLFALAAYLVQQRTREIGIRKVLGASLHQLSLLLSKDFLRFISLAVLIAVPLSWWATQAWLQTFAYRISGIWLSFFYAAGILLAVAIVTISFQVLKAARANPVRSLRTD